MSIPLCLLSLWLVGSSAQENSTAAGEDKTEKYNNPLLTNYTDGLYDKEGKICCFFGKYRASGRIRIKIGHIGALNALRNDVKILEVSHVSLRQEGILDDDFDVE